MSEALWLASAYDSFVSLQIDWKWKQYMQTIEILIGVTENQPIILFAYKRNPRNFLFAVPRSQILFSTKSPMI